MPLHWALSQTGQGTIADRNIDTTRSTVSTADAQKDTDEAAAAATLCSLQSHHSAKYQSLQLLH